MTRGLTSGFATSIAAEVARRATAVQFDLLSGTVRWNTTQADIVIDGETFVGLGVLGAISPVEESGQIQSYSVTVQIRGIPRDAISLALNENYQNRPGAVYELALDANWQVIPDHSRVFRGRLDQMDITHGATSMVTATVQEKFGSWENVRMRRFSAEDQAIAHPGDRGLEYAASVETRQVTWPSTALLDRIAQRKAGR